MNSMQRAYSSRVQFTQRVALCITLKIIIPYYLTIHPYSGIGNPIQYSIVQINIGYAKLLDAQITFFPQPF